MRAVGTNNERKRAQSRACPAGPEITSYSAVTIASMLATSAGAAAGTDICTGWSVVARGVWASTIEGRARHNSRVRRRIVAPGQGVRAEHRGACHRVDAPMVTLSSIRHRIPVAPKKKAPQCGAFESRASDLRAMRGDQ
jgi:hypothetical protein